MIDEFENFMVLGFDNLRREKEFLNDEIKKCKSEKVKKRFGI